MRRGPSSKRVCGRVEKRFLVCDATSARVHVTDRTPSLQPGCLAGSVTHDGGQNGAPAGVK